MGIFKRLFGSKKEEKKEQPQKGDKFVATNETKMHKVIIDLTEEQKKGLRQSTLPLRAGQLFMHYWEDNLAKAAYEDEDWKHRVVYFWKAEEPFEKKSLPLPFMDLDPKYFLFKGDISNLEMEVGEAIPWFGMPGGGMKYSCNLNEELVSIPQLFECGNIDYVERVELTNDNLDVLIEGNTHNLLIDERMIGYSKGEFYLDNVVVPIDVVYSIGGLHIIKRGQL
ncbi:MAG: TNT domain-containing protein [Flavobacteriaceae bacterium]|jgi:hypothetical protein|nr:TNT domain-containing protein [Flavobacteriaceae bacterium]